MIDQKDLICKALKARENAYASYSAFTVGAALLARDGRVFLGANVENASFGATLCAERAAFGAAVSAGVRDFAAVAVVGGKGDSLTAFCPPCGICRQVMAELCCEDFQILLFDGEKTRAFTLKEMLPYGFGAKELG